MPSLSKAAALAMAAVGVALVTGAAVPSLVADVGGDPPYCHPYCIDTPEVRVAVLGVGVAALAAGGAMAWNSRRKALEQRAQA